MKKYIRMDCDNVGDKIDYFLYHSEASKAQDLSNSIKNALNETVTWIKNKISNSEVLLIGADDILFTAENITEVDLEQLKNIFSNFSNTTISIGVGNSIRDSMQNLSIAKVSGKNQIVGM